MRVGRERLTGLDEGVGLGDALPTKGGKREGRNGGKEREKASRSERKGEGVTRQKGRE